METCDAGVPVPSEGGIPMVASRALDAGSCLDGLGVGRKWGSIWTHSMVVDIQVANHYQNSNALYHALWWWQIDPYATICMWIEVL